MRKNPIVWAALLSLATGLTVGCDSERRATDPRAPHQIVRGPVAPPAYETKPLRAMLTLEPTTAAPAAAGTTVDARLLLITADGTDPAYLAVTDSLRHLGTPFDVFNATAEPPLTADRLATGTQGKYYGVILDLGNLSAGGASAFADAEWTVLSDYESQFGARRAVLYAFPEAAYGLSTAGGMDTSTTPLAVTCTTLGSQVFADLNCDTGLSIHLAWAYPASVTDANTQPILVDGSGNVLAAIRHYDGGREAMVFTFAQSPSLTHSLALLPDVINWVTRGVFLGERHVYDDSQIDDLFLTSDIYGGPPAGYRISAADLQALADWQTARHALPSTPDLRFSWALNGEGSEGVSADPLTARAVALGSAFKWISHTWDHAYLDSTPPTDPGDLWAGTYAAALEEFTKNDALIRQLGLQPYDLRNIVTPGVSGLTNPEAMKAVHDFGIRFMVGDTSVAGYDNPSPNTGIWNSLQPDVLIIPRRPTNLFYNVSTPAEWQAEYNAFYHSYWGRDLTVTEIIDFESDLLVQYLLRGETNPWMFHQANARNYGNGRSLIADLHDRAFSKYVALSKLPIVSPTMDQIGGRMRDRMTYDAAGATASIGPGATITVRATNAATIPVTGLCTPAAESYGGHRISYLKLAAGAQVSYSLQGCNDGPPADAGAPADAGGDDAGADGVVTGGPDAGAPDASAPVIDAGSAPDVAVAADAASPVDSTTAVDASPASPDSAAADAGAATDAMDASADTSVIIGTGGSTGGSTGSTGGTSGGGGTTGGGTSGGGSTGGTTGSGGSTGGTSGGSTGGTSGGGTSGGGGSTGGTAGGGTTGGTAGGSAGTSGGGTTGAGGNTGGVTGSGGTSGGSAGQGGTAGQGGAPGSGGASGGSAGRGGAGGSDGHAGAAGHGGAAGGGTGGGGPGGASGMGGAGAKGGSPVGTGGAVGPGGGSGGQGSGGAGGSAGAGAIKDAGMAGDPDDPRRGKDAGAVGPSNIGNDDGGHSGGASTGDTGRAPQTPGPDAGAVSGDKATARDASTTGAPEAAGAVPGGGCSVGPRAAPFGLAPALAVLLLLLLRVRRTQGRTV